MYSAKKKVYFKWFHSRCHSYLFDYSPARLKENSARVKEVIFYQLKENESQMADNDYSGSSLSRPYSSLLPVLLAGFLTRGSGIQRHWAVRRQSRLRVDERRGTSGQLGKWAVPRRQIGKGGSGLSWSQSVFAQEERVEGEAFSAREEDITSGHSAFSVTAQAF